MDIEIGSKVKFCDMYGKTRIRGTVLGFVERINYYNGKIAVIESDSWSHKVVDDLGGHFFTDLVTVHVDNLELVKEEEG